MASFQPECFDKDFVAKHAFEDNDFTGDNSMTAYLKSKKKNKKHVEKRNSLRTQDFKLPEFESPRKRKQT